MSSRSAIDDTYLKYIINFFLERNNTYTRKGVLENAMFVFWFKESHGWLNMVVYAFNLSQIYVERLTLKETNKQKKESQYGELDIFIFLNGALPVLELACRPSWP